jgi:hypothetical protein
MAYCRQISQPLCYYLWKEFLLIDGRLLVEGAVERILEISNR